MRPELLRRRLLAAATVLAVTVPLWATPPTVAAPPPGTASQAASAVPPAPVQLVIETEGRAPVVSRDRSVAGSMQLEGVTHAMEIEGRGNSTWGWPKKPFKLELDTDASLLGMPAADDWVLLANFADRSSLRTHLAFSLAAAIRPTWTPRSRFVELVLNGESRGLYLLTEQVERGEERVVTRDNGFLLEVDQRFRATGDPGFKSRRGTPIAFKDPDELEYPQPRRVKRAVREFEDVLYGDDFADPVDGYASMVDVASFVDWYLVEELFRNQDSNFYSSVFVTWNPRGRFAMGPVWDFDLSAGSKWNVTTAPQGWHTRLGSHWIARMLQDPSFAARVKTRWSQLRPVVSSLTDQIPAAADSIRAAALADWSKWHNVGYQVPGGVHADSFDGEVAFLRDWLTQRSAWMSRDELVVGAPRTVVETPSVVQVPIRVLGDRTRPVTVRYAVAPGTATRGADFRVEEGTLELAAGETTGSVPVTILGDTAPEPDETIQLLVSASDPEVLGGPTRSVLTIGGSDQRLDAMVGRVGGAFVGRGVSSTGPRRQTARAVAQPAVRRAFRVRVVNRGNAKNVFTLTGSRARPGSRVRYLAGSADVSRALRSRSGWSVTVGPGRSRTIRVLVDVARGARPGSVKAARVRSVWRGDSRQVDVVRAAVRVR